MFSKFYKNPIILVLLFLIFIGGLFGLVSFYNKQNVNNQTKSLNFSKLEIADQPLEMEQGLMNRKEMCNDCGMLFVFENESLRTFWMKDTYISLDIIFLDKNGEIVKIHEKTKPLQTNNLYFSEKNSQFVLEVNAGFANSKGLNVGDKLEISKLRDQGKPFEGFLN